MPLWGLGVAVRARWPGQSAGKAGISRNLSVSETAQDCNLRFKDPAAQGNIMTVKFNMCQRTAMDMNNSEWPLFCIPTVS